MSLSPAIARGRDGSVAQGAAVILTFLAAITAFVVSAMTLDEIGVLYDAPGGSFLAKLHPATYLSLIALIVDVAGRPGIADLAAGLVRRPPKRARAAA